MKIRPVILCGGAGTRLWEDSKKNVPKQFIDFGGWCLFEKTLDRIKDSIFDHPIISTNSNYIKEVKKCLRKSLIKKYKIIVEPFKKNTAPAILAAALINEIPSTQPIIYFSADHIIEKFNIFKRAIYVNKHNLNEENIFIFGIKPTSPSTEYGYFTSSLKRKINVVTKFIEKPNVTKAKKIINQKGCWNSGIFFLRKDSIINNFKKLEPKTFINCTKAVSNSKYKNNTYYLNKKNFKMTVAKSFDTAILEKTKQINSIKLNIPWSDLGSWKEILKMYNKNKNKYYKSENIFFRPWGKYINLFKGKGFLVKELYIKSKASISLQKHFHRSEQWLVTQGNPQVTIGKKVFLKKINESIIIPKGSIHRIRNPFKKIVKIIEIQLGSVLKETDILRYKDIYGRVK